MNNFHIKRYIPKILKTLTIIVSILVIFSIVSAVASNYSFNNLPNGVIGSSTSTPSPYNPNLPNPTSYGNIGGTSLT
jgi:hypothetical protein